jgi:hypothetical protein
MLNELVERIEVHAPDRSTGKRLQRIEIYFNFVGNIGEVWEEPPLFSQISTENRLTAGFSPAVLSVIRRKSYHILSLFG